MTLKLNPNLDLKMLAEQFNSTRRLRIKNILTTESAIELRDYLVNSTAWHLVHSDAQGKPVDYPPNHIVEPGSEEHRKLTQELHERATHNYQYIYKYFPIINAIKEGTLDPESMLFKAASFLNSTEFIAFSRKLTGTNTLVKVDPQATLYEHGHFLSTHDDSNYNRSATDSSLRRYAVVLGLTKSWENHWGGQTSFFDESQSDSSTSWYPCFNTLTIFEVPAWHSVSYVTPLAAHGRYSLTGWLRDDPNIKRPDLGDE